MVVIRFIVNWIFFLFVVLLTPIILPIMFVICLWEDKVWKCSPMDGSEWIWEKDL